MIAASSATLRNASAFPGSRPAEQPSRPASPVQARSAEPALALEGIGLAFGGVAALDGVGFTVGSGQIRAIIGPNGAGKSSLINVISGIYRPDRGRIRLAGHDFRHVPTTKLATLGVARTFQNLALFKGLDVLGNVVMGRVAARRASFVEQAIGLGRARRERDDALDRAERMLDYLDLRGVRDRSVATLPYGLQKRVELARALVSEPRILLLDEPMAGMTEAEKGESGAVIRDARARFDLTVVMIEHDIGMVMGLSDTIAVLDHGRLIADGTPAAVQADQAVIDAYLGVPHDDESEDAR